MSNSPLPLLPAPADLRGPLLDWFRLSARALPWRETSDSYRIWVSEVMLQQTRVDTVVPYYARWLERFPTVTALAEAPQTDVLQLWAGLGYYSRARNLHRAAQQVRERHGGVVPSDPELFRALPGVGEYTAGAVGSIAFGHPVPAVDGNVRRVFARLMDEPAPTPSQLRGWATALLDPEAPGDSNQALMELGATVCTPKAPRCGGCPIAAGCAARAAGTVQDRPLPKRRATVREVEWGVVALIDTLPDRHDHPLTLLRRRPEEGLLGGMWEFPSVEGDEGGGGEPLRHAVVALARALGGDSELVRLPSVPHLFSHIRALYHPWHTRAGRTGPLPPEYRWVPVREAGTLPLPVAQQRILGSLVRSLNLEPEPRP